MSDSAVSQLIEAARVPRSDWQRALRHIRDVTNSPLVAGFAEDLEAELETAEPVADPDRAGTSWIWNLAFVKQVGLLVVALEILEAWSEWLVVMFSDEELPPELTQTTRLLFLLIGALMIVFQLRSEESSDDD